MIHQACNELTEMGFNELEQLTDNYGTIGYALRFVGNDYVLVAKEYSHDDLASFMTKLVVNLWTDVDFIFYNKDSDSFTVFDGKYLNEHSDRSSGPSKKRECSWREISLSHGADLDDYIRGNDSPDTMSGENEELGAFI